MTNKEHKKLEEVTKRIRQSNQTILKVPYRDTITDFSHISKELLLKTYQNSIGKTITYLEVTWRVVDVTVVGDEIRIILCK